MIDRLITSAIRHQRRLSARSRTQIEHTLAGFTSNCVSHELRSFILQINLTRCAQLANHRCRSRNTPRTLRNLRRFEVAPACAQL